MPTGSDSHVQSRSGQKSTETINKQRARTSGNKQIVRLTEKVIIISPLLMIGLVLVVNLILTSFKSEALTSVHSPTDNDIQSEVRSDSNSGETQDDDRRQESKEEEEEKAVFSFLATTEQDIQQISLFEQPCSETGYKFEESIGAKPERCGVSFTDRLLSQQSVHKLQTMASKLIAALGETTTTNRESCNLQWLNLHSIFRKAPPKGLFNDDDYDLLVEASLSAKSVVSMAFGIPEEKLYFTTVCQFTRYEPITNFSEFRHVDKVRSPELIVTSILWLSTVDVDFAGGRLEFLNGPGDEPYSPILIEPKKGRYAAWTSSHENPHGVQELWYGERLALIFAFTANKNFGHKTLEDLRTWATLTKPSFYY